MRFQRIVALFAIIFVITAAESAAQTGFITTVAGTGTRGFNADNILATDAHLFRPHAVALDTAGNLFIADRGNHRIRRVDAGTGFITTVAGTGLDGFNGDNILATIALLTSPTGVALDTVGNLFIADTLSYRIRRVDAGTGIITTVAGTGAFGFNGDGIHATNARLSATGVAVDAVGHLFIADLPNNRIRRVDAATGIITTVAGNGTARFNGDNILGTNASLNTPFGVAFDTAGNLFIADRSDNRIRRVEGIGVPAVEPRIQRLLAQVELLVLLPTGNLVNDRRINKALAHLAKSTDSALWASDSMPLSKKVFDEEKKALKELRKIKVGPDFTDIITPLLEADKMIATDAIQAAIDGGGDPRDISNAQKELAKAAAELAKGHWDHAVDKYKKAGEKAMKALS